MNDELNERRRSRDADGPAPPGRPSVPSSSEHLDAEVLAGYLDYPAELPDDEHAAIASHLASCASCRETLAELRAVVVALSALPEVAPTRSFALTPAMAGVREAAREAAVAAAAAPEPVVMRQTSAWHERQMRAVRWATVAAAVLFVFVLSADIASNRFAGSRIDDEPVSITARSEDASGSTEAAMADDPDAPPAAENGSPSEADTFRAAGAEPTEAAAPAAAYDPDQPMPEPTVPGEQDLAMQQEEVTDDGTEPAEVSDRRSMSSSDHYWRLAQVGLALLIVWLLAAMIALPRLHARNRK